MLVKLTIRTQSLSGGDVELECELDWSILKLKEEIQKRVDHHPIPEDQRLVYAGKMLDNYSLLQHVLRMEDDIESHTVHLVCRQISPSPFETIPNNDSLRQRKPPQQIQPERPNPVPMHTSPTPPPANFDMNAWTEALRQHQMNFQANPSAGSSQDENFWLNHMYTQYMAHQYMQYLQTTGAIPPTAFNNHPSEAFMQPPGNQNPPNAVPGAVPGQNQPNVVLNAGAGGFGALEDDENGGQRDVLDWFYVASRVLVLFSILYFYASFARFALVTCFGLAAYMWNIGFFRRRHQPMPRPQQPNPPNPGDRNEDDIIRREVDQVRQAGQINREGPELDQTDEVQDDVVHGQENVQTADDTESMQIQEPQPGPPNPLATTFTFITTFFSSLLPEQPQVV